MFIYIVKAMSDADRAILDSDPDSDEGGQDIYPIASFTASSDRSAERILQQRIKDGTYPWDAVVDRVDD